MDKSKKSNIISNYQSRKYHNKILPTIHFLAALTVVVLSGCGSTAVRGTKGQPVDFSQLPGSQRPDDTLIVDCLLPGKIKKMGASLTFLTPRRPIKASAMECEIRGGEYVAYDRANYETALRIWQPRAEEGDKVAQTYVGVIYEKGLGVAPNYAEAAKWYRKAAEQGYARAQNSLGYLYELGLGVPKDPKEAFKWYRKASGLGDDTLPVVEVVMSEKEKQKLEDAAKAERELLDKVKNQIQERQTELETLGQQLTQAKRNLEKTKQRTVTIQKKSETAATAPQDTKQTKALQKRIAKLQQKASALDKQLESKEQNLAEVDERLKKQREEAQKRTEELNKLTAQVQERKQSLQSELSRLEQERVNLENRKELAVREGKETQWKQQLASLDTELSRKKAQLSDTQKALERQQALAKQKGKELLAMLQDYERRKTVLQADFKALEQASWDLRHQREDIEAERKEFQAKLSSEQERRRVELRRQEILIKRLEAQKKQNEQKLADLQRAEDNQQLALFAPKIEIVDPNLPIVRGLTPDAAPPITHVSAKVKERDVVGKVISPKGLLLLTVNDRKQSVDQNGVFKVAIDVPPAGTLVNVVAVDPLGNRGEKKFVLAPDKQTRTIAAKNIAASKSAEPAIPNLDFGNYHALIIGNNNYLQLPHLKTPVNDARAVADVLKSRYRFKDVRLLLNANRYQIITALNKLRQDLTEKDNLLIYYAGHGELDKINMKGQWLPIDAEASNTANWISNSSLTELINAIPAKHVMVVADSCYSGIMTRSTLTNLEIGLTDEAKAKWIEKMLEKRSRTVLTSGGVAPVLDEGGGDHSIFAKSLLEVLNKNSTVLEGQELFREVSAAVTLASDRYNVEQVPEYAPIKHAGHESGDFFFVPVI